MKEKMGIFAAVRWGEDAQAAFEQGLHRIEVAPWAPRGPTYEGWDDFASARDDVRRQIRALREQGHQLDRMAIVMNLRTGRRLRDLAMDDDIIALQLTTNAMAASMRGDHPTEFAGLPVQIDETIDKPTVRLI
jgi:hypothetical protein